MNVFCFLCSARDNLVFLQKWLEKYPEYKNRNLFLTGESYGGYILVQESSHSLCSYKFATLHLKTLISIYLM